LHKNVLRQLAFAIRTVRRRGASQQIASRLVHNLQISGFFAAGKRRLVH
jgi:hypothetical protein